MKIIEFELYYNNEKISTANYAYLEDDINLYLYDLRLDKIIDIKINERINFYGFVYNNNGEKIYINDYELILKKHLKCDKDLNCLVIECEIDFSDVNYDYDQDLIDLFYFWGKENILYDSIRKNQYVYTLATLLYSGIPKNIPNNITININGNNIESKYGFYNTFAENLLGKRTYIGNGFDSLIDSFRESKVNKSTNQNVVNIEYYEILAEKLNFYSKNYLDEIITILEEFGFNVNKS